MPSVECSWVEPPGKCAEPCHRARRITSSAFTAVSLDLQSDVQRLQVRDALHRQLPALLDEVVLQASRLRRREDLRPVDRILADGQSTAAGLPAATGSLASATPALRGCRRLFWRRFDGRYSRTRRLHPLSR